MSIPELSPIRLRHDLPDHGLRTGDVGAVVFVHAGGKAYEVEFLNADGYTVAVLTLDAEAIEALDRADDASSDPKSDARRVSEIHASDRTGREV